MAKNVKSTLKITLDFYNNNIVTINSKQLDTARFIEIICTDNGVEFPVDSGAVIRYKKPDGKIVLRTAVDYQYGHPIFEITSQMVAVKGKAIADIMITDGDTNMLSNAKTVEEILETGCSILSTMKFYVNIDDIPIDMNDEMISEDDVNIINAIISVGTTLNNLNIKVADAEEGRVTAEESRCDSETQRINSENARQASEKHRMEAESTRQNNESIRNSAESTRQNNESIRNSAESTRQNNESTRQNNEEKRVEADKERSNKLKTALEKMGGIVLWDMNKDNNGKVHHLQNKSEITLNGKISEQNSGIVLIFGSTDAARNYDYPNYTDIQAFFVPKYVNTIAELKYEINPPGSGDDSRVGISYDVILGMDSFYRMGMRKFIILDDSGTDGKSAIKSTSDVNGKREQITSASGISYDNYVFGLYAILGI